VHERDAVAPHLLGVEEFRGDLADGRAIRDAQLVAGALDDALGAPEAQAVWLVTAVFDAQGAVADLVGVFDVEEVRDDLVASSPSCSKPPLTSVPCAGQAAGMSASSAAYTSVSRIDMTSCVAIRRVFA
jgi:hypothetical protein